MHFFRLSVCHSFKGSEYTMLMSALKLTYALMDYHITRTYVVLIETMCSDLDPGPYLEGQGHT